MEKGWSLRGEGWSLDERGSRKGRSVGGCVFEGGRVWALCVEVVLSVVSLLLMKRRRKSVVSFVSVFFLLCDDDGFGDGGRKRPLPDPTGSLAPSSSWTRPSIEHESAHLLRQAHPLRSKEEATRVEYTKRPSFFLFPSC